METQRTQIASQNEIKVTVLSPLHIGSGGSHLLPNLDYYETKDHIVVIDADALLAELDATGEVLPVQFDLPALVRLVHQRGGADALGRAARYTLPRVEGVREIVPQSKDMFGHAYLPGSSLKGAIRTALAWAMLKNNEIQVDRRDLGNNPRYADDPLLERLFGSDPNHDLLRALQISDTGALAKRGLELSRVQLYNLTGNPGQTTFAPKKGFEFFVETMTRGSVLRGQVRFDEFLLSEPQARKLGFGQRTKYVRDWLKHCNDFAKTLIARERAFFSQQGLREIVTFYDGLAKTADELSNGGHGSLLQISWGTGWTAKTVSTALSEELITQVRREFRLGRSGQIVFPKTRRVVIREERPESVMGWVKITSRVM